MSEIIKKVEIEDFYVLAAKEEKFEELVEEIPERFKGATMYSIDVVQKKPDWIHNKRILDFKLEGEPFHCYYLCGWFIDEPNVDGLCNAAKAYIEKFVETPKPDRDVAEAFSEANTDNILKEFNKSIGVEEEI